MITAGHLLVAFHHRYPEWDISIGTGNKIIFKIVKWKKKKNFDNRKIFTN